jgi:hypothetical protein
MHGRRLSWLAGGIGLISCGVVGIVRGSVLGFPGTGAVLTLLSDVLWAAAILVLSIGLGRGGSIVARRPLGLGACVFVAVWPLVATLVELIAVPADAEQAETWVLWSYLSIMVVLFSGLIAATQVARARVVPAPWNRVPLWVFGFQVIVWVIPQVVNVASPEAFIELAPVTSVFGTLGYLATTLGLGIAAVVLSRRPAVGTVPIFESPTQ